MTPAHRPAARVAAFVVLVALVSLGAWAGWGIFGWATVMGAAALWLFWKAATAGRPAPRIDRWRPLVAVTDFIEPFEAELACHALEAEGIRALYGGRADQTGAMPGGGVLFADWVGKTRVAVREEDADRARQVLERAREVG